MNSLMTKMVKDLMTDHSIGRYAATETDDGTKITFTAHGVERTLLITQVTDDRGYGAWLVLGSVRIDGETRAKAGKRLSRFHAAAGPVVKWARQAA